ncbi:hypothetical protein AOLI_G00310880 [Acnodon oligacanthus]
MAPFCPTLATVQALSALLRHIRRDAALRREGRSEQESPGMRTLSASFVPRFHRSTALPFPASSRLAGAQGRRA